MRSTFLLALALLFLVAGCSRSSFIGQRYDNFTAYYNTFYNAENAYDEGVESIEQENQPIDRDVYLPLFSNPDQVRQVQAFNDAIEKSADILREHPDSKWVDDALLLIGESYFHLQNYVGAEQKFREVISLGSRLEGEARFWLARTLIAAGRFEEAQAHLQESLNQEDLDRRWEARLRLAEGELAVKREDWEAAATELEEGLEDLGDNDLAARGYFLLGQVYETLERYDAAVAAYERVTDYNPLYELGFAARFSAVHAQGLHGDPDEALRMLRRMERDDKNYENRAELAYLRGRIYQEQRRADAAFNTYFDLLYESDANTSDIAGKTYYALGTLHRDLYRDYSLAAAYFDTAATRLRSGSTRGTQSQAGSAPPTTAPAAVTDVQEQQRVFSSFRTVMNQISRMDSLLQVGALDDEAFQEFVLDLRKKRAEELAEQRRLQEERQAEEAFRTVNNARDPRNPNARGETAVAQAGEAGFLFHRDQVRMQQGQVDFVQRWGDRPLVPDWRRIDAISAAQASARGEEGVAGTDAVQPGLNTPQGSMDLPTVDVSDVPRDPQSRTEMRNARAVARYELANVLFLSMNRPDSAATWYRMVIDEDSSRAVAQRAYYALAEVQQALGDTLTAQRLYHTIIERFPRSEFAGRAREQLGLASTQQTANSDTLALARGAYEQAYATWQDEAYATALDSMITVAIQYPETPAAPRALLAAGMVYQEWARRDSLDLEAPLPLSVPDSVLLDAGLLTIPEPEAPSPQPGTAPDSTSATVEDARPPATTPAGSSATLREEDAPDVRLRADEPVDSTTVADSAAVDAEKTLPRNVQTRVVPDSAAPPASAVDEEIPFSADSAGVAAKDTTMAKRPIDEALPATAAADTAAADTAAADTAAAPPEPAPLRLQTLYERLVALYPESPQADRARLIVDALKEQQQAKAAAEQAAADSIAQETSPQPSAAEPLAVPRDSTRAAAPDTTMVPRGPAKEEMLHETMEEDVDEAPVEYREEASSGQRPVDQMKQSAVPGNGALAGRWMLVTTTTARRDQAEAAATQLRSRLDGRGDVSVHVVETREEGTSVFKVGVGSYATEEEARLVHERLGAVVADAEPFQVPPQP